MLSPLRIRQILPILALSGALVFLVGCGEFSRSLGHGDTELSNPANVILTALGGLAILALGMKLLGGGIRKIAGEGMIRLLKFFSRHRSATVLAGALSSTVLLTSDTAIVTAIGFVNAGLLNLSQAIGLLFGANIGTTITTQLLSFNLTLLILPAVIFGFLLMLLKQKGIPGWGESFFGFGLLFLGMSMMIDGATCLRHIPEFRNFLACFDCRPDFGQPMALHLVLGALLLGTIITILVRSGAVAMAIVLALGAGGVVNLWTAVPLLVGTNLGTTIATLGSAGKANRVAKQAALANTLFNGFGAALMIALLYLPYGEKSMPVFLHFIDWITPGTIDTSNHLLHQIAIAHTVFNVGIALLLLPFIGVFARFCNRILPIPPGEQIPVQTLEPSLLGTPSVALKQTVCAIRTMVEDSWEMIDQAINAHFIAGYSDAGQYRALAKAEEQIDAMQADVTAYLVRLTRRSLTEPQSELIPLLMHCTNDAERIADHTELIVQLTERLLKTGKKISLSGKKDLRKLWHVLDSLEKNTVSALGSTNPELVKLALKEEKRLQKLAEKLEIAHSERLRKGKCQLTNAVIFIEMLGEMTKIAERLANIAERTPEIQKHYIEL